MGMVVAVRGLVLRAPMEEKRMFRYVIWHCKLPGFHNSQTSITSTTFRTSIDHFHHTTMRRNSIMSNETIMIATDL